MNILLTGSSGFIGKHLYEGLKSEYHLFTPTRTELNLLDSSAVRAYIITHKIKIVIHTAVQSDESVLKTSIKMFLSFFGNIDLLDKFITFGSGSVYAKTRDLKKVKETEIGAHIPEDDYGIAKLTCSLIGQNNKKIVALLPFGVFGEQEDYRRKFISNTIVKNLLGLSIKIKQDVLFDYLSVNDLVDIVKLILKRKKIFGDFNITPDKSITLSEIAELVNLVSSHPSKIHIENKQMNFAYTGSNEKLKMIFPRLQFASYHDAITQLYSYYASILKTIDKDAIQKDVYFKKSKIKSRI